MVFEFEGGAVGTLAHSWETPGRFRGLQLSHIAGTRGSIVFESNGLFILGPSGLILPGLTDIGGYHGMLRDFVEALRTGRESFMTLARARRDLEMLEG
jgi:predicted dehydrogenase